MPLKSWYPLASVPVFLWFGVDVHAHNVSALVRACTESRVVVHDRARACPPVVVPSDATRNMTGRMIPFGKFPHCIDVVSV